MTTAYKKALHSFFLKVHPDFFATRPTLQRHNETAISRLNELLDWSQAVKRGENRAPPQASALFTFHQRDASAPTIDAQFELPPGFSVRDTTRGVAERSMNQFLRTLLRRAGCLDDRGSSLSAAQDDAQKRAEKSRQTNRRHSHPRRRQRHARVRSLLDEAQDVLHDAAMPSEAPSVDELITSDHILFDKALSPLQCAAAVRTLSESLPLMRYHEWYGSPLLIGSAGEWKISADISFAMHVPWNFTLEEFKLFLNKNGSALAATRESTERYAREIETLIAEICNELLCDDVVLSCNTTQALPALRFYRQHTDLLRLYDVQKVTLELGDAFATRANGILVLDLATRDLQHLRKKLRKIQPKMPELQKRYAIAREMLESTLWHIREFSEAVRPQTVDVFGWGGATYSQRLTWAKELHRAGPPLSHWDWSGVTFGLGPELVMDWEANIVILPWNFDADALCEYMRGIQTESRQKARQKLAAYEVSRRAELSAGNQPMSTNEPDDQRTRSSLPEDDGLEILSKKRPAIHEYLSSDSQGQDAMNVERPLAHHVSFPTDTDTKEQLEWEGFHRSPYIRTEAPAAEDETMHGMLLSNRWAREEAVKRVIDDLDSKYGRSKEFAGLKLGDLLRINDPSVEAKGMPGVKAPGTYQGEGW